MSDPETTMKIPAYGQFFHCQTELFGQLNYDRIFTYLFNEHLRLERLGKPTAFNIAVSAISTHCKVGRQTVYDALKLFDKIGLVVLNGSVCNVNKDYFYSVVVLFSNANAETRQQISQSFMTGDKKALRKLGLLSESIDASVLSGTIMSQSERIVLMKTKCSTQDNSFSSEQNVLDKTNCLDENNIDHKSLSEMAEMCSRWNNIDPIKTNFKSKKDFIDRFSGEDCTDIDLAVLQNIARYGWDCNSTTLNWGLLTAFARIGLETVVHSCLDEDKGLSCTRQSGVLMKTVGCLVQDTVNKYKERKKENEGTSEASSLYRGRKDESEEKPSISFGMVNPDIIFQSPEKEDEEGEDENFQKSSERQKRREALRKAMNPYRNKPYYSKQELSAFLVSPILAAESPVKQCLWLFWDGIYRQYEAERYVEVPADEYGELIEEATEYRPQDTEGFIITKEDAMRCLLMAYEDMKQNLKKGYLTFNDGDKEGEIEIKQQEFDDFLPSIEHILDWETVENIEGKESWKVSLNTVRNIEADDVSQISSSMTKEEKQLRARQDRAYNVGLLNAEQSQLSDLEKVMRRFLKELVDMDEEGYGIKTCYNLQHLPMDGKYVAGHTMKPWCVKVTGEFESVGVQDFYDVLNAKEVYKDGMDLDLRCVNTPFSYRKSLRWHQMHGMKSSLLDEIPSE